MHSFIAIIQRFGAMGDKTNWFYITIPLDVLEILQAQKPKSLRVKGLIDAVPIASVSLRPIGNGVYILPINTSIRKLLHKTVEDNVHLHLFLDTDELPISAELIECLEDEPLAMQRYKALTKSWQNNFNRMILEAKTPATTAKRIAKLIEALLAGETHEQMMEVIRRKD